MKYQDLGEYYANLIWFAACFPDLSNNNISVNVPVYFRIALYSNKTMFLTVIEPVTCTPSSDYSLKLICFDPNDLLNTFISPKVQAGGSIWI